MKRIHKRTDLHLYRAHTPINPNAADDQYFSDKALDLLTGIVSAAGMACAMVFLVMLA